MDTSVNKPIEDTTKENVKDKKEGEPIEDNNIKNIYTYIRDINTKQYKIEQYFKNVFDNKKYDNEVDLKKGLLQLLNDLINDTSISSNSNRKYLYVLNYKIKSNHSAMQKLKNIVTFSSTDKNLKENELYDENNEMIKAVSASQKISIEEINRKKKIKKAEAIKEATEFDLKRSEEISKKIKGGGFLDLFDSVSTSSAKKIENAIQSINREATIEYNIDNDVNIILKSINKIIDNVKSINTNFVKIINSAKTSKDLEDIISAIKNKKEDINTTITNVNDKLDKIINDNTSNLNHIDKIKKLNDIKVKLDKVSVHINNETSKADIKLISKQAVDDVVGSTQSEKVLQKLENDLANAKKNLKKAQEKSDSPGFFTSIKTAATNLQKAKDLVDTLEKELNSEKEKEKKFKSKIQIRDNKRDQSSYDEKAATAAKLKELAQNEIDAKKEKIKSRNSEANAQLDYLNTEDANELLNEDPSFTLDEKLKDIQYKSIYIIEYSTKNLDLNEKDRDAYVKKFREHIKANNKGKIDLTDKDQDKTLIVKKYPLQQFFINFNKTNGFHFNMIKKYEKDYQNYVSNVKNYNESLNSFIEYLDNYINNWEMKDIGKYNIYYMVKNYWGSILTILMIIILVLLNFKSFFDFVYSIYKKSVSFQQLVQNDSMYSNYDDIYEFYGYYIDFKNLALLGVYIILAMLIIPINLYNTADVYRGNIRIVGCKYTFNKNVQPILYYGILLIIFIIILGILYIYMYVGFFDTLKIRNENHKKLQDIIYKNLNEPLSEHLYKDDIIEDNIVLLQVYEKLNNWAYNGTKEENDERAGNNTNNEDLINKRFSMLITSILCIYYINKQSKDTILNKNNLLKDTNFAKSSIFMYSKKDVTNNILPQFSEFKNTKLFKSIIGPLPHMRNKKCLSDDKRYFCDNELYKNNIYTISQEDINKIKDKYNLLRKEIKEFISGIKETDSVMLYRLDVIYSLLSAVLFFIVLIYIFALMFLNVDMYAYVINEDINLENFFNVIVVLIILIVIL